MVECKEHYKRLAVVVIHNIMQIVPEQVLLGWLLTGLELVVEDEPSESKLSY